MKGGEQDLPFDWSVEGILDIFGGGLYSSPFAFVRELIQNAHDACWEREFLEGASKYGAQKDGDIRVDFRDRILTVQDNGAGLNETEAKRRLSKIAHNTKRTMASQMSADMQTKLIGNFGVGLLSAVAVASNVEIESKRCDDSPPILWTVSRGRKPRLRPSSRTVIGTTVRVTISTDQEGLLAQLDEGQLRTAALKYCRILPVKVYCDGTSLTPDSALWDARKWDELARSRYEQQERSSRRRKQTEEPVIWVPVESDSSDLVEGVLYVPRNPRVVADGFIDVYIRRIHLCEDHDQLLPKWAGFVRGFLNSNNLERVASGERIVESKGLEQVREALNRSAISLVKKLFDVLAGRKSDLRQFGEHVKVAIVDEPGYDLLRELWKYIPFPVRVLSTTGRQQTKEITLPEYFKISSRAGNDDRIVFAYEEYGDSALCSLLQKITTLPIVDATREMDALMLRFINDANLDIIVRPAKQQLASFIEPYDRDDLETLVDVCKEQAWGARIVLSTFEPDSVPALYLAKSTTREEYVLPDDENQGGSVPILYLNANNSLIRHLGSMDPQDNLTTHVLAAIHNNAFMLALREVASDELEKAYETYNIALEVLLERADVAPIQPIAIEAAVVVLDLVGSTYRLASLDFEDRGDVFYKFVEAVRQVVVRNNEFFDKFTGDGLIAIFSSHFSHNPLNPAVAARFCAAELRIETQRFFETPAIKDKLRKAGQVTPRVRVGAAYGRMAFGSFGGRGTVLGKPVIQACRLCDAKDLHEKHAGMTIATLQFAQAAELTPNSDYEIIQQEYDIRGLGPVTAVVIVQ